MPEKTKERTDRVIDLRLVAAGWLVQGRNDLDLAAGPGIAIRDFPTRCEIGFLDYLLYLDRKALAVKVEGSLLTREP
jgi:type I restriction enzyme R subunit